MKKNSALLLLCFSPESFAIKTDKAAVKVLAYGKEVNGLRRVDYYAVTMPNVSATQELYKMLKSLKEENQLLKAKQRNTIQG